MEQQFSHFNLYDIFSNFLPGAVFLIGAVIPYVGTKPLFVDLKFGSILVWIIVSFSVGLFIQAIGGWFLHGDDNFKRRMRSVTEEGNDDSDTTAVDVQFIEAVRSDYDLSADFKDWSRLYKLVLAALEPTSESRTLRLQALYLGMRGMAVAGILLFLIHGAAGLLSFCGEISLETPVWLLVGVATLFLLLGLISLYRASEFSEDVTTYMILEYNLNR